MLKQLILPTLFGLMLSAQVHSASIKIDISDSQTRPIADAVVELISAQETLAVPNEIVTEHYEIQQQNRTFNPFVLAIPQGAKVDFPNLDKTRHHVYSFSEAKPFELKLYVGKAEAPVLFDKPGLVAIGCNIHDYMQAFIYVAKSPYVGVSDDSGHLVFNDIPKGSYLVKLWHPWQLSASEPLPLTVFDDPQSLSLQLQIKHQPKPSSPPAGFSQLATEKVNDDAK
ncbi:methylamine utilization protein [Shewanella mesophila]|uniref:methylamine utilization protein n=1 Tax=Shewanella mesophila TaxID=2864208 RepID=UPI001C65D553|nr:methylamine utilization protein [Shewanella mesophila]QYJ84669.1 methylamine utilization protein [Shewanella mesophila]